MTTSKEPTNPIENQNERQKELDLMGEKTKEMMEILEASGKEFSVWDCLSFACITLVGACEIEPRLKPASKFIIGTLVDGNIQLKHSFDSNGISVQKK